MTTLDLNMECYTKIISPASQDKKTIITKFGKFRYNHILMMMCDSREILHNIVYKILGDIKNIKTYIEDILVLSKDSFSKHKDCLRFIYDRLRASGLKLNTPKCSFG